MQNEDKAQFSKLLNSISRIYNNRTLTSDDLGVWWFKLKTHDWDEVSKAFDKWSSNMRTMPVPSDINALIRSDKAYRMVRLDKPKPNMIVAREKLEQLKEKFGWKK